MTPKLLLRTASIFMLLHTIGHTMGSLSWKSSPDPAVVDVVKGMIDKHFVFMGKQSSIADFYSGYGITLIFVLLLVSALLWILSLHTGNQPFTKQIGLMLFLFLAIMGAIEWVYFFPLASVFSLIAALLTGIALIKIHKAIEIPY